MIRKKIKKVKRQPNKATKMNEEKQIFIEDISMRFKLRDAKRPCTPTIIYIVISCHGKRFVKNTGVRVKPNQWNRKRQCALVSNLQYECDNSNNRIANERLKEIKGLFYDSLTSLNEEFNEIIDNKLNIFGIFDILIKKMNSMAKKRTDSKISVVCVIKEALEDYKKVVNPNVKESTMNNYRSWLKPFISYIENEGKNNDREVFSQKGLIAFKEYLINKKSTISKVNQECKLVAQLINKVLTQCSKYDYISASSVNYANIPTGRRQEDKCAFALQEEEVKKLLSVKELNKTEKRVMKTFRLMLLTGTRHSDAVNLFRQDEKFCTYDETNKTMVLGTKKKSERQFIEMTDEIWEIINAKDGLDIMEDRHCMSEYLKSVAKKAGLNRKIKYKDTRNNLIMKPVCEAIKSHCARHTFAHKLRFTDGKDLKYIAKRLGHKDETMVQNVYGLGNVLEESMEFNRQKKVGDSSIDRKLVLDIANDNVTRQMLDEQKGIADYLGVDASFLIHCDDIDEVNRKLYVAEHELISRGLEVGLLKGLWNNKEKTIGEKKKDLLMYLSMVKKGDNNK